MSVSITNYSALDGKYIVHGTIGAGGFGKVKKGIHVVTGEKVAIKVMDKRTLGDDLPRAKLEIEALKNLHHQNICKMYEVIETDTKIFIILEHCSGGEMFDYIVERDRLEENEARFFFRQIVAAVAYIHSQGYAHRDLKPENILLDEEQNVKLIDFGLCARPKGGMGVQLETFCGSPAYAAPELISGKEYLGSEVDIWSLGILLFTLLCGYLPFDDDNMGTLYRKIQSGSYEFPHWLSSESKNVINRMLQTEPKHRITIGHLLKHSWLQKGYEIQPVYWTSIYENQGFDDEVMSELALYFAKSKKYLHEDLSQWKYDYLMSTYFLLLHKKKRGSLFKLSCEDIPLKVSHRTNWELSSSLESGLNNADLLLLGSPKQNSASFDMICSSGDSLTLGEINSNHPSVRQTPLPAKQMAPEVDRVAEKENFAFPVCPPTIKKVKARAPGTSKVPISGTIEGKGNSDCIAVVRCRGNAVGMATVMHHDLHDQSLDHFQSPSLFAPVEKRCHSIDLDTSGLTTAAEQILDYAGSSPCGTPAKSNSARQRVFGSIERRMDKVRCMLTPKKKSEFYAGAPSPSPAPTPRKIKVKPTGLYNVSVVGRSKNEKVAETPDAVLDTLQRALESKGIPCNRKGFILRNKIRNEQTGKVILAFELEICQLLTPSSSSSGHSSDSPLLGVCRKRLKGDTWIYKNVVEEVLKVLNHLG